MSLTVRLWASNWPSTVLSAGLSSAVVGNTRSTIRSMPLSMASTSNSDRAVPLSADRAVPASVAAASCSA